MHDFHIKVVNGRDTGASNVRDCERVSMKCEVEFGSNGVRRRSVGNNEKLLYGRGSNLEIKLNLFYIVISRYKQFTCCAKYRIGKQLGDAWGFLSDRSSPLDVLYLFSSYHDIESYLM